MKKEQTRKRVDKETRLIVLLFCKKYEQYKGNIEDRRANIIYSSPSPNEPRGGGLGDSTASKAKRLISLNECLPAKIVESIDQAKVVIGNDLPFEAGEKIKRAIWLSCLDGRKYNFEAFAGRLSIERREFYYYKRFFIWEISKNLEI